MLLKMMWPLLSPATLVPCNTSMFATTMQHIDNVTGEHHCAGPGCDRPVLCLDPASVIYRIHLLVYLISALMTVSESLLATFTSIT